MKVEIYGASDDLIYVRIDGTAPPSDLPRHPEIDHAVASRCETRRMQEDSDGQG